jgi:hypothetical protein
VATWYEQNQAGLPEAVRLFMAFHQKYLDAEDVRGAFNSTWRELRRALGITPSSEKRPSGSLLAGIPADKGSTPRDEREKLEQQLKRTQPNGSARGTTS